MEGVGVDVRTILIKMNIKEIGINKRNWVDSIQDRVIVELL